MHANILNLVRAVEHRRFQTYAGCLVDVVLTGHREIILDTATLVREYGCLHTNFVLEREPKLVLFGSVFPGCRLTCCPMQVTSSHQEKMQLKLWVMYKNTRTRIDIGFEQVRACVCGL